MMWVGDEWTWGSWALMALSMVAFWALVAVVGLVLIRALRDGQTGGPPAGGRAPSAEQILEERFARGEIDLAEFEHRRRALRSSGPTS
jgi:putative membrane protein